MNATDVNNTIVDEYYIEKILYIIYICQGSAMFIFNSLLIITILVHVALRTRKEYILICGLCIADAMQGAGFLTAGMWRLNKIFTGRAEEPASRLYCLLTPHNIIWNIFETTQILSVDRLLLVLLPVWYLTRHASYGLKMVSIPFVHGLVAAIVGIFMMWPVKDTPIYDEETVITEICFLSKSQIQQYNFYHASWQLYGTLASVLVYAIVIVLYLVRRNNFKQMSNNASTMQLRQQKKMLASMGAISVMTFVLVVVPMFSEWSVSQFGGHWPDVLVPVVSITINMNPIIKLGILLVRHTRVRAAIKSMLICRKMPADINQWATQVNPGSMLPSKGVA